jgi:hypothetical protein
MLRGIAAIAMCTIALQARAEPLTRAQKAKIELFKRGAERASLDGNHADAVAQLDQALRVLPDDPELVLLSARAYDAWGDHCPQALGELKRFFKLCGDCALLARAKNDLAIFENRCASEVTIESQPAGAIVQIAGEEYARATPFTTTMKPGAYSIDVRRHGYLPKHVDAVVEPATTLKVGVKLDAQPVPKASAPEMITEPVLAEVKTHETPLSAYLALGGGVAGGIAGALFSMDAMSKVDDERTARYSGAPIEEVEELRSSAKTSSALAVTGFAVAVVGFAASIVLDAVAE